MSHKSIEILNARAAASRSHPRAAHAGLAGGAELQQLAGSRREFFNELVAQDTRAHEAKALRQKDFSEGAQLRRASLLGDISTARADVS
jgi:hypothetical protein